MWDGQGIRVIKVRNPLFVGWKLFVLFIYESLTYYIIVIQNVIMGPMDTTVSTTAVGTV